MKSLVWRAIIGDAALGDFRGKDCSFVANWLRGKGLNKLCAVFAIFINILFDNGSPSVIYVPVNCPRGGGI